jgi:hypothetical protein
MHEIAGLLAKLKQIASRRCGCSEHSVRAVALVNDFSAALYQRLGIEASNRPTTSAKSTADQTFVELRRQILAVEARRRESLRTAFTAARHRVDMERRVLAARIVTEGDCPPLSVDGLVTHPWLGGPTTSPSLDRQSLAAVRRRLAERGQITRSRAAIEDSLRLLGLGYAGKAACLRG